MRRIKVKSMRRGRTRKPRSTQKPSSVLDNSKSDSYSSISSQHSSGSTANEKRDVERGGSSQLSSTRGSPMLNGVDYESYFSPRPTSRPRGKGKAKVEPRNKGRGKTKPKLDLDRLAVQDGTSVASAGSDEAVSIFLELQNRRNERRGAMFSNIDSLFSTFEKLDGLTPEMRAQAAEARKVLIQDINDISHEAMTAQLMEMKRQERALETDDEATGADLARLMSRSPLAATVASWMDDIEENEKGGEDEDEEIKDRDKKKADKNMDNANSSAGFRKHDGSEDGSTSSGSLQSEEGPSSDEAGSTAGVLEQYPWVGSGSSDGFDGDEDENEVEMEYQDENDQEVTGAQDFGGEDLDGDRWGGGLGSSPSMDDDHASLWSNIARRPKGENVSATSGEEDDDMQALSGGTDDELLGQSRNPSRSPANGPRSTSIERWVEDQATRLAENNFEIPDEPTIRHIETPPPPEGSKDAETELFKTHTNGLRSGLNAGQGPDILPPPPKRQTTRRQSEAGDFPTMDALSPESKPSADEAETDSRPTTKPGRDGTVATAGPSRRMTDGHEIARSGEAIPREARSAMPRRRSSRHAKKPGELSQVTRNLSQSHPESNGKPSRHDSARTKDRSMSSGMERKQSIIPGQDEDEQEERKSPVLAPSSKAMGSTSTAVAPRYYMPRQPKATPSRRLGAVLAQTLPVTPSNLHGAPGEFLKAQYTAWVELFWFQVTGVYWVLHIVLQPIFDHIQIICARFEYWIEYPLPALPVSALPQESQLVLATQICLLVSFLAAQVYVAVQRERAVWMEANGLTRMYMLEYVHEDPSWRWLPGVDPNLMVGWGEAMILIWNSVL